VDFVVTVKNRPWFAVEAKLTDTEPSPQLSYFGERLGISHLYQVVAQSNRDFVRRGVRVVPASRFLAAIA
jgi:hypothetical protein